MGEVASIPNFELLREDLCRHFAVRRGSRNELARRLELTRQALHHRITKEPPLLSAWELDQAFKVLGLDPYEFYRGVAHRFHPEFLLHKLQAKDWQQVSRFRGLLAKPSRRSRSPDEAAEIVDGLEELRFRDPQTARRLAIDALRTPELEADVAAEAFGIAGVVDRYRGRIPITAFCFDEALRLHPSPPVHARTLQRYAMLALFNAGSPELARKALQRARELYIAVNDFSGLGKTYVDEGVVFGMSGEHELASAANQQALTLLREEDVTHRLAAFQGLAISSVFLSDIPSAYRYLDEATAVSGKDSDCFWLVWLRGEIALLMGQFGEAVEHLVAVWDTFLDLERGSLDQTLIQLRIAKAYFLQGDQEHLEAVLEDILRNRDQVQQADAALGAALGEFLRSSARGCLSAELLEDVYQKMRGGTELVPPLLPSTLPLS